MKFAKYLYIASLVALASCGKPQEQQASLNDFDFVDHVAGHHAIMYFDSGVNKVKFKVCQAGPFDRTCPAAGPVLEMTWGDFIYNIKSMFGILDYEVSRTGLERIEAARAAIRIEIASGTLTAQEKADATLQLSELDAAYENLERGVFYAEQVVDASVLTSVSSIRQDFRRLITMFKSGTKIKVPPESGDKGDVFIRYFGEGTKQVAKERCQRLGGISFLDLNEVAFIFGTRLNSTAFQLNGLFERYPMNIVDDAGKTLRTTTGLGYWLNNSLIDHNLVFDAETGKPIQGRTKPDKLSVLCLVEK